jgi:tetratricopeptide (TPR) repeat protein
MTTIFLRRVSNFRLIFAGVFAAGMVVNCSSLKKSEVSKAQTTGIVEHVSDVQPGVQSGVQSDTQLTSAPAEFRAGLQLLSERKFTEALAVFDHYTSQNPTAPYAQATELNSGRALEGLERYSEAAERYRGIVVATNGIAPRLEAMALYRSSFCHEALGEDQQTVAVLVDLFNRLTAAPGILPEEIAHAELPARLAAVYARIGNYQMALDYYKKAESGIARLRHARNGSVPNWLPRTLYFMGRLAAHPVTWDDFESALRPLAHGQIYLLEASDLGIEPWADRSATDLITIYQQLFTVIEKAPQISSSDPLIEWRVTQSTQWQRATMITENLQELVARKAPGPQENLTPASLKIFAFVEDLSGKLHEVLAARPAGEGLTPESLTRSQAVRGRVVTPDGFLERKFIESSRSEKPLPEKAQIKKDPNL